MLILLLVVVVGRSVGSIHTRLPCRYLRACCMLMLVVAVVARWLMMVRLAAVAGVLLPHLLLHLSVMVVVMLVVLHVLLWFCNAWYIRCRGWCRRCYVGRRRPLVDKVLLKSR